MKQSSEIERLVSTYLRIYGSYQFSSHMLGEPPSPPQGDTARQPECQMGGRLRPMTAYTTASSLVLRYASTKAPMVPLSLVVAGF